MEGTLIYRDDFTVNLLDHMGGDESVVRSMLVSTQGSESVNAEANHGRINFLMKNRHGTPFEHNSFTFLVEAPIFVFREFQRHRIGFSYNEVSGRYKQLDPVFYIPPIDRPLIQEGKPGAYTFVKGDLEQYSRMHEWLRWAYSEAWVSYITMLDKGIAKEVARMVLPTGIYSGMYVTCNARSLMNFLSLRTHGGDVPSYPMWEIEQVAKQMELRFKEKMPVTWETFNSNGRIAP